MSGELRVERMRFQHVATAFCLTAALLAAPRFVSAQDSGIEIGAKAPGAAVETLEGKATDLAQYLGKQPVLIEFWATWCPNCRELEPTLKAVHEKYAGKVRFVGVSVSVNQSPERIKAYVAKHGIPGDQLFDRNGAATGAYDVPATSYVVVLDRSGKVVYTGLGGDQDLEKAIKKAL